MTVEQNTQQSKKCCGHGHHGHHHEHGHGHHCCKGKKRFVVDPNAPVSHQVLGQMQRCGHLFHHSKDKTPEELLAPLTASEQQELLTLLLKIAPAVKPEDVKQEALPENQQA